MEKKDIINDIKKLFFNRKVDLQYEFDHIEAAILLPIVDTQEGTSILFEVRSPELNWQPGEICFPGGKIEETDKSPMHAAIRETCEELQLSQDDIIVYGQLDRFYSQLGVMAHPYVGKIKDIQMVKSALDEVDEIFTVPLEFLLKSAPEEVEIELTTRPISDNFPGELIKGYQKGYVRRKSYKLLFYRYKDYIIWGFTARILKNFLDICKGKLSS